MRSPAILSLLTPVFGNIDSLFDTDCIFLEFAKAASYDVLFLKLNKLHFDQNVLAQKKSFLQGRSQYAVANNSSSCVPVTPGVSQGSAFWPLLSFLLIKYQRVHFCYIICIRLCNLSQYY